MNYVVIAYMQGVVAVILCGIFIWKRMHPRAFMGVFLLLVGAVWWYFVHLDQKNPEAVFLFTLAAIFTIAGGLQDTRRSRTSKS